MWELYSYFVMFQVKTHKKTELRRIEIKRCKKVLTFEDVLDLEREVSKKVRGEVGPVTVTLLNFKLLGSGI